MYILDGKDADLEKVIKEQRIRIQRGLVRITPIEEAVMASKEELDSACENIKVLTEERDKLVKDCDEKDARIKEMEMQIESLMAADAKNAPDEDAKNAPVADTKEAPVSDEKKEAPVDSKKTKKGK